MALPLTGEISLDDVNVELRLAEESTIAIGSTEVREFFEVETGSISMSDGRGASNADGSWLSTTNLFGGANQRHNGWGAQNSAGDTLLATAWRERSFRGRGDDPSPNPYEGISFISRDKDGAKLLQSAIDVSNVGSYREDCKGSIDDNRNIYLAYNDDSVSGQWALVVFKINSSGVIQWQKSWPQHGLINDLTVTGSGDIYIAGARTSSNSVVSNRAQMTKINTNGTLQWVRVVSSAMNSMGETGWKIIVGPNGNIFMSTSHTNSGSNLFEFNSSGVMQGTGISFEDDEGIGIPFTIDSNGNIYALHYQPISGVGTRGVVIKMNSSGVIQESWVCQANERFAFYGDLAFNETTGYLAIASQANYVPGLPYSHSAICFAELDMTTGTCNFSYNFRAQALNDEGDYRFDGRSEGVTLFNSEGGSYQISVPIQMNDWTGGEYQMQIDPNALPFNATYGYVEAAESTGTIGQAPDQPMVSIAAAIDTWAAYTWSQGSISRTATSVTLSSPTNQSFSIFALTVAVDHYYTTSAI